jgi:hypothetical protein
MRICAHDLRRTERQQKRNPMISVGFARVSKKRPCRNRTSQFEAKHLCPSSMPKLNRAKSSFRRPKLVSLYHTSKFDPDAANKLLKTFNELPTGSEAHGPVITQ